MGLREDFRAALASIAASVTEAAHVLRHGDGETGTAVQASSRDFAGTVSDDAPVEAARYIVNPADFPTLEEGAAVELDGSVRSVVSMKTDPVGATATLGLSAEFDKQPCTYSGSRRENNARRTFRHPFDVLTIENGVADNFSGAIAPTYATSYTVAIRRDDWPETTDPMPSDTIEIAPGAVAVLLKVSAVTRHDGWYIIKCRTRD